MNKNRLEAFSLAGLYLLSPLAPLARATTLINNNSTTLKK